VIDSVVSIRTPTPTDDWVSLSVPSHGEYGIPDGLVFGFPVRSDGKTVAVVEGLEHDDFAKARLAVTRDELLAERSEVTHLLG